MNVLCTICIRSGSKGLKNKCIKKINGKPLLEYTIDQAKKLNFVKNIVVSTDSRKIANLIKKNYGLDVWYLRPYYLSKDSTPKIPVIRDTLFRAEKYYKEKYEIIMDLDVTSPLRSINDVIKSYNKFIKFNSNILFTVSKSKKNPYFNMVEILKNKVNIIKKRKQLVMRRQDAPKVYDMNASIYIWKRSALIKNDSLFTSKTSIYEMLEENSIDIDSKLDFKLVEYLLKLKKYD